MDDGKRTKVKSAARGQFQAYMFQAGPSHMSWYGSHKSWYGVLRKTLKLTGWPMTGPQGSGKVCDSVILSSTRTVFLSLVSIMTLQLLSYVKKILAHLNCPYLSVFVASNLSVFLPLSRSVLFRSISVWTVITSNLLNCYTTNLSVEIVSRQFSTPWV